MGDEVILAAINGVGNEVKAIKTTVEQIRTEGPLKCKQGDAVKADVDDLKLDKKIREHDAERNVVQSAVPVVSGFELRNPFNGKVFLTVNGVDAVKIAVLGMILVSLAGGMIWMRYKFEELRVSDGVDCSVGGG